MSRPDYKRWMERIDRSRKIRDAHQASWTQLHKLTVGRKFRSDWDPTSHGQPAATFNKFVRLLMPHLLPRDRELEVSVNPKRPGPEYARSARLQSDRVSAVLREIKAERAFRRAARAELYSNGFLHVGYHVRTGIIEPSRPPQAAGGDMPAPDVVDVDRDRVEGQEFLDADLPFVQHVPATRVFPEPGSTSLADAGWVAVGCLRRLAALRVDPAWKAVAETLKATHQRRPQGLGEAAEDGPAGDGDPDAGLVLVYYLYARDAREVLVFPDRNSGVEQLVATEEWPAGIEGIPLVQFRYEEVEDHFWTNPVLGPAFDAGVVPDEMFAHTIEQAKRTKTINAYDSTQIKPETVNVLATLPDGGFAAVPGISQHMKQIELGGLRDEHWRVAEASQRMAEDVIGMGELQQATGSLSPRASATEVSAMMANAGIRTGDLRGAVQDGIAEAVQMVGTLLIVHADMMADIALPVGDPKEMRFVALGPGVVGEALDYGYQVTVASVEKIDPAVKQKRRSELIAQTTDPALLAKLQAEGKTLLTGALLEEHLREMGRTDVGEILVDAGGGGGADPTQKAQAEDQQMLETGEVTPVDPSDDHAAELQVHLADWEQTGADPESPIAAHAAMHEQYLGQGQAGEQPGMQPVGAGAPGDGTGGMADEIGAVTRGVTRGT